ncbi:MAG: hypothetical protein ABIH86_02245 [Planctomycetota bacterium]
MNPFDDTDNSGDTAQTNYKTPDDRCKVAKMDESVVSVSTNVDKEDVRTIKTRHYDVLKIRFIPDSERSTARNTDM